MARISAFRHTGHVLHALKAYRGYRKSQLSRMTFNKFHLRRRRESNPCRPPKEGTDALDRAAVPVLAVRQHKTNRIFPTKIKANYKVIKSQLFVRRLNFAIPFDGSYKKLLYRYPSLSVRYCA